MKKAIVKKCKFCRKPFKTRTSRRKFCNTISCTRKRRAIYLKKYMDKWIKKHPAYWKNPKQLEYLKRWRQVHPDYFNKWRKKNHKTKELRSK